MNQLGITGSLLLSQIVNFVLLMVILRLVLYGPVMRMLDQRKERIAQSMKDAERVAASRQEAEQEKERDPRRSATGSAGDSCAGDARR